MVVVGFHARIGRHVPVAVRLTEAGPGVTLPRVRQPAYAQETRSCDQIVATVSVRREWVARRVTVRHVPNRVRRDGVQVWWWRVISCTPSHPPTQVRREGVTVVRDARHAA